MGTYICSDIIKIHENDSEFRVGGVTPGERERSRERQEMGIQGASTVLQIVSLKIKQ